MLSEREWKLDSVVRLGMLVLMSMGAGLVLAYLATRPLAQALHAEREFVMQVISFSCVQGLAIIWISMFLGEHDISWTNAFGFRRKPGRSMALAGATTVVALPFAVVILGGLVVLLYRLFDATPPAQVPVSFINSEPPIWQLGVIGFAAVVLVPVAEEALFRGVLYTTLKQFGYRHLALWGNALLFALIHFNLALMLPLFFLALVWTWLYERTGNLIAPITGHVLFNGINFLLVVTKAPEWWERAVGS